MDTSTTVENAPTKCVECGVNFSVGEMIRVGKVYVCGTCKPIFVQKLAEGAETRAGLRYAGFWIRFGALLLDSIILGMVNAGIRLGVFSSLMPTVVPGGVSATQILVVTTLIPLMLAVTYETYMIGRYGATVGKLACHIKVVTADGAPVSFARAFGRYFAHLLSTFTLCIGYIIAAFDPERRTLHDRLCNTRVIEN